MPHPGPRKREQETWCWDESSKWLLKQKKLKKKASINFSTFIWPTLIQVLKRAQSHVSKACR